MTLAQLRPLSKQNPGDSARRLRTPTADAGNTNRARNFRMVNTDGTVNNNNGNNTSGSVAPALHLVPWDLLKNKFAEYHCKCFGSVMEKF